jgi:hypothetical protein
MLPELSCNNFLHKSMQPLLKLQSDGNRISRDADDSIFLSN